MNEFLTSSDWDEPLEQFSEATGLTVSLYSPDGERRMGPFAKNPVGKFFAHSDLLDNERPGGMTEQELARVCAANGLSENVRFSDAVYIGARPIFHEGNVIAVLVYGWIFDHFTDFEECSRITEEYAIENPALWTTARSKRPISQEKVRTYASLLETLALTIFKHGFAVKKLREADQIKDDLLANVSHELKTPLTSMILRFQTLRLRKYQGEKLEQSLLSLERAAQTQLRLIDDLLDAARMLTGKLRIETADLDLVSEMTDAIETVTPALTAKKIKLELEGFHHSCHLNGDSTRLQQVFWNLIANAVKFTPEGGNILVSIRRELNSFKIKVKDTGVGIQPAFLPYVFDRFAQHEATLGRQNNGLGIGLSIVKHIVELHGGEIRVHSEGRDQGTTFEVSLPYSAAESNIVAITV